MDFLDELTRSQATTDEAEGRVYGWLPGIVTEVDSDLKMVKARIGKQGDNESSNWLIPMGMGSVESLPEVNDPVGVCFMDGDVHRGAYFYYPQSTTKGRPTQPGMLGAAFVALYLDLVQKFNALQSNYQSFYTAVQGHTHASFGTVSSSLLEATIGATCHNNGSNAGKPKNSDGSLPTASAADAVVLSKRTVLR